MKIEEGHHTRVSHTGQDRSEEMYTRGGAARRRRDDIERSLEDRGLTFCDSTMLADMEHALQGKDRRTKRDTFLRRRRECREPKGWISAVQNAECDLELGTGTPFSDEPQRC